ncbi:MAG: 5-formyltetrahydrofolate cyclo-ligase [Candidatus Diapherotrites archaeon]
MKKEKQLLREKALAKRGALSAKQVREKSRKIAERLFRLREFIEAKNIFCYMGFGNEVQTRKITEGALKSGKGVFVPKVKGKKMLACAFTSFKAMEKSAFGIFEPKKCRSIPLKKIDLVIAPGLAFDRKLNRLGFGKGFYDRFLKKLPKKTKRIALAFECQVFGKVPAEKKDEKMDFVVTEKRVLRSSLK